MDEKTQLLELPGWFQEIQKEHRARDTADAEEPTVVVSEALTAVTVRVGAVQGPQRGGQAPREVPVSPEEDSEATVTMPALDAKTRPVIDAALDGKTRPAIETPIREAAQSGVPVRGPVQAGRTVRAWDRMRLASVTQAQAAALGDLVEVAGGERLGVEMLRGINGILGQGWRGVGSSRVGVHWEDDAAAFGGGVSTWWRVMPGWERGLVWVDDALARQWLQELELLHLAGEQAHGAICCVLGEVVGGAMMRSGWPQVSWGVNPLPGRAKVELMRASRPPYVEWVLEVERGGVRGQMRVAMPWTLVRMVRGQIDAPAADVEELAWMPGMGRVSVGGVRLALEEVRALGPGDVVLVGEGAAGGGEGWSCGARLAFGPKAAWGGILRAGAQGRWVFEVAEEDALKSLDQKADPEPEEAQMSEAVERAEVEVEVVVGALRLQVGELSRLVVGQVLETGSAVGGPVRLMVGEREVARGELVEVEGRLGVRVERVGG